jgi:hypothetical protein
MYEQRSSDRKEILGKGHEAKHFNAFDSMYESKSCHMSNLAGTQDVSLTASSKPTPELPIRVTSFVCVSIINHHSSMRLTQSLISYLSLAPKHLSHQFSIASSSSLNIPCSSKLELAT